MTLKGERKQQYMKQYTKEYYKKNREKILAYRKTRKVKNNKNWRNWFERKKDKERKAKISLGQIYKPFNPYGHS